MVKDKTQEIKKRLRDLRSEKGLKQESVAKSLHSDRTNISKWENPKNNVLPDSITYYEKLADVYGVSIDYILCRDNTRSVEDEKISQLTGLSEHSIEVLKQLKKRSGKLDNGMVFGKYTDNYSWKNVEMINHIFDSKYEEFKTQIENNVPVPSILSDMYEYIHSSTVEYMHRFNDVNDLFGIVTRDKELDYENMEFWDKSSYTHITVKKPSKLYQAYKMEMIQKWLMEEADKQEKEVE